VQPDKTTNGNISPPSYHVKYQGSWHPLEFVNRSWYWLEWDDDEYLGYWVKKASKIEQGHYNLGSGTREIEIETPTRTTEISKAQEWAELGSTQPSNQDSSSSGEDDPVDKNPGLTENWPPYLKTTWCLKTSWKPLNQAGLGKTICWLMC